MTLVEKIDFSKKAIDTWNAYNPEEKGFWMHYLGLKKTDTTVYTDFQPYTHQYTYRLTDEDAARIVFCASVEIIRYNLENKMLYAIVGNSGGLDSAVTCSLLSKAAKISADRGIPFTVTVFGMPIHSNPDHHERAEESALSFGLTYTAVDGLSDVYDMLKHIVEPISHILSFNEEEVRRGLGNIKARIRMIINFFASTKSQSYVVSTDNLSELYMAFWTLMGDVGAFGPIQNVLKGLELPVVAYSLQVPARTLGAKPTDGLNVHTSLDDQEGGDTDAFKGVTYPHLDAIICHAVKNGLVLDKTEKVTIDRTKIDSPYATDQIINGLIAQMVSSASVWKRTKGSIGSAVSRDDLGLPRLDIVSTFL